MSRSSLSSSDSEERSWSEYCTEEYCEEMTRQHFRERNNSADATAMAIRLSFEARNQTLELKNLETIRDQIYEMTDDRYLYDLRRKLDEEGFERERRRATDEGGTGVI